MQFFSRNCTHILARTHGKNFGHTFLVKIASKRTSLKLAFDSEPYTMQESRFEATKDHGKNL